MEKHQSYEQWIDMLKTVIAGHYALLKPGGFLVINIADILCFPDEAMPRIQAMNLRRQRSSITRENVLAAKAAHPHYSRYELAAYLGAVSRRLIGA